MDGLQLRAPAQIHDAKEFLVSSRRQDHKAKYHPKWTKDLHEGICMDPTAFMESLL